MPLLAESPVDTAALARRFEDLRALRRPFEGAWQALADHFLPTRFCAEGREEQRGADLLNSTLVDATGVLAMRTLAAGLHGGMTSPARPWFRLAAEDPELARYKGVPAYLDECASRMRAVFHRSNFYNAVHNIYAELGTFGTAFLFELADAEQGFRFLPLSAGEYVLDTDEHRRVDTVFRRFTLHGRQLARAFGEENLPESLRRALDNKSGGSGGGHTVVHAVTPREGKPGCCPYVSVYWLEGFRHPDGSGPHILRQGFFGAFPGFGPRWCTVGNDVYGRSPAMDALPDCRMLQQMGITMLKAAHKAVDPPMSVSASLKAVGLDLTPGGINYVESSPGQIPQAAAPLLATRADMAQTRQAMQAVQEQVKAGLFNDLFRLIMDGRGRVTASEIAAREEEKLLLIGPVLERLHGELFIPLVERTYTLMGQMGMLPEAPPPLRGQALRVDFVSLLAQAQKLVATSAVDQYLNFSAQAARQWPEALDCVNVDNMADSYAEYLGLEARVLRPLEEREALRGQRALAQTLGALQEAVKGGDVQAVVQAVGDTVTKVLGRNPAQEAENPAQSPEEGPAQQPDAPAQEEV